MALSMLGLRVRAFDAHEEPLDHLGLSEAFKTFDALIDPPLVPAALAAAVANERTVILLEANARTPEGLVSNRLSPLRSAVLTQSDSNEGSWQNVCGLLGIGKPAEAFPAGAPREFRLFRDGRSPSVQDYVVQKRRENSPMDDSPWVLPSWHRWRPVERATLTAHTMVRAIVEASMTKPSTSFPALSETFPGNLASFAPESLEHSDEGVRVVIDVAEGGWRPFRSGAFASVRSFTHGRFQADVRAAAGSGLITGFFLHRGAPRQEIDIEFAGSEPRRMLTNVFFNPGDDGAAMAFGYRGSPCWIDLGFDATEDFHEYAIDWRPGRVTWLVDGKVVHERGSWDPTPIPHLGMRLHANLWAPRSRELAGRMGERTLPASACFRNVLVAD